MDSLRRGKIVGEFQVAALLLAATACELRETFDRSVLKPVRLAAAAAVSGAAAAGAEHFLCRPLLACAIFLTVYLVMLRTTRVLDLELEALRKRLARGQGPR